MTSPLPRRIARIQPLEPNSPDEQFFAANDAPDFDSDEGKRWTLVQSPFPGSRANAASPGRPGWEVGAVVEEASFRFLAPSVPVNVFGMAHNTGQPGRDLPPQAFHKAASSVIGPGDAIQLSSTVGYVDPEAELTVVVGSTARGLTLETARSAILGYTIGNDVSARDLQKTDELWISAKSQDTFTPAGPWIVTALDDSDLEISIVHNGNQLTPASSADLGWKVEEIMVYLTSFMTLRPGDLVLTGFPAECARIQPGDTVACRVEGIGELRNPVIAARWEGPHA
ncbi:fumarylacetoacetate hydrolase family protein [Arthrobacter sp. TES]|uniref:Fumarylacetoacetate hydrolase family protein n=1 Tax=Paenarthrobacter ureafaciens TaxID=37931 RepID=A0AAX3EDY4_PAEUR|nr:MULTISPECIES: fumarylacetoacetate hydrolase family protein [Paenarthrobacter]AOY70711.1 fumarylacetoacetate hydrolase [Arthrobacter sp. ZXY-2]ERI39231.1 fumarylacetoacetate hydrolase [Arthrobacter sp. AK-YN10]NKR13171.1 fumarylacetoacetate hydrolase [Arthrobacter sp. M5]NKR14979.1 fumarylacetoacetate hydrolase [Arthrobacter sp. M6]OEH62522.1 fumarylacetoacetate hydrolase [Arthrobacter sp. D4]OEH63093.1 fumarylacetoacetate hydrolase [Arthrobacter sp. D2]QOI62888.1 fumarylacetoacetate hydro